MENDDEDGPEFKIVSGGYKLGKLPTSCEDAYFIHDRGFGVADGVSGWIEYGFHSKGRQVELVEQIKAIDPEASIIWGSVSRFEKQLSRILTK